MLNSYVGQKLFLLVLICSILNACKEEASDPPIVGIWRVESFVADGQNVLDILDIEEMIYDFDREKLLAIFQAKQDLSHKLTYQTYKTDPRSEELYVDNNGQTDTMALIIVKPNMTISGVDDNGAAFEISLIEVKKDLCEAASCTKGSCYYGHCLCDQDWTGVKCDLLILPRQIKITQFGLENIPGRGSDLVNYPMNPVKSKPDTYAVFSDKNGNELARSSVLWDDESCSPVNSCPFTIDITLDIESAIMIRWYDDDITLGEDAKDALMATDMFSFADIFRSLVDSKSELELLLSNSIHFSHEAHFDFNGPMVTPVGWQIQEFEILE